MTTVLKLGGSVITDKSRPETVDERALARATDAIADAGPSELVLVHGGGSFGHPAAERHGLSREVGTRDVAAVTEVTDAMQRLNDRVLAALHERSVPALRVPPLAMAARTDAGEIECADLAVRRLREEGFLPALHGDLVGHAGVGCSVVSGDELAVALGRALEADRLGFCSDVPGVLDPDGEVIDRIDGTTDHEAALSGSAAPDVTGGMAAKVAALASCELPAAIFGLDTLPAFLAGELPGTTIE